MTEQQPPRNDEVVEAGTESEGDEKNLFHHFVDTPNYMNSTMRRQMMQEVIKSLPSDVQNRIKALKNLQLDYLKLESKFYEEVYQLERKYQDLYAPILDKRKTIITGEYEPAGKEVEFKSDSEDEEEVSEKLKAVSLEVKKNIQIKYPADVKGIPEFWLLVFRNSTLLSEMIQEHDEVVLKKLKDISIKYAEDVMSYTLEFHFEPNDHFTNSVLTKQYFLKTKIDKDDPFSFEGTEIYKCVGCEINWNKGMNLTVKTIKKKQKHKARGAVRTITKQVPNDSFFNFFSPPDVPEDESKLEVESETILASDFEIGHYLRARVIPKAVLYFIGEIDEDDDDDDMDEEEEEDEEEDEEDGECGKFIDKYVNKKEGAPECKQQ